MTRPPSIDWVLLRFPGVAFRCLIGLQLFQTSQAGNKHFFINQFLILVHSNKKVRVWFEQHLQVVPNIWGKQKNCGPGFVGSITLPWELCSELSDSYFAARVSLRHPLMKTFYSHKVKIKGGNIGNLRQKDAVLRNAGSAELRGSRDLNPLLQIFCCRWPQWEVSWKPHLIDWAPWPQNNPIH